MIILGIVAEIKLALLVVVGVVRGVGAEEDALVSDDPLEHRRGGGVDEDGRSGVEPGELVEVDGRESVAARPEDLGGL